MAGVSIHRKKSPIAPGKMVICMPKSKTVNTTHILLTIKKPSSKVFKNKKNTIIRLHKKNFYVGANGLINLNKGWKLNNNGLYTYYVEKNGTVSVKISMVNLESGTGRTSDGIRKI